MSHHALDYLFGLRGNFLFHIFFQSPEHERLEDQMKPLELMLVELTLIHRMLLDIFGEPLLKLLVVIKKLGHDEVEQGPKLCHRVLDWGTGEEKSVPCVER